MAKKIKRIAIIEAKGIIADSGGGRDRVSFKSFKTKIDKALKKKVGGIFLVINSPGGSPVQSELIAEYIDLLKNEKKIKVVTYVQDVGASGGYFIASSGNKIYCLASSIVGSIGVVSSGFGFAEFIKKHGIDRRVYTAGENKSLLDPFKEEKKEDVEFIKDLQIKIHEHFKNFVKRHRKNLKTEGTEVFTGKVFLGQDAKEIGLIDEIATMEEAINKEFGKKVKRIEIKDEKQGLLKRLSQMSLGKDIASELVDTLEAKLKQRDIRF